MSFSKTPVFLIGYCIAYCIAYCIGNSLPIVQCELIPRNRLCWTRVPLVSYDLLKIELENGKKREGKGGMLYQFS